MTLLEGLQQDMLSFLSAQSGAAPLLKRVFLFLEDGEFTQADAYCEKVLDIEPENALAYLGKLMASRRLSSLQELADAQYTVDGDSSFKKALRFAPEDMKQHLQALNMQIYGNCIAACRNRARIHLSHGELKETAQQYHNAMQLWEDSRATLPNAQAVYNDLANEVADFNWMLLLHNRQCPDDQQLISRGIPIDTDRWYLSAIKWADEEKQAHFASIAKQTLFSAHLKCMDAIQAGQTKLAGIWADHYRSAAPADDPLPAIHQALVQTNGYGQFVPEAPAAMLKLIGLYTRSHPQGVAEIKAILQEYYQKIFQSILDFSGQPRQVQPVSPAHNEETYTQQISQREAQACVPAKAESTPVPPADSLITEAVTTDPAWATETARQITAQMAEAVSSGLSPYGLVSTYLVAAKALTIRYGRKDGIVTSPYLFRFICGYYEDAIGCAQSEQAAAIQEKLNEFLTETIRLPGASPEIVSHASACMQGSDLPYRIYLSRLTNDYSVEKEKLISTQLTEELAQWQRLTEAADPKKDFYWLSDRQEEITATFVAAEKAISACKRYPTTLQDSLNVPYQTVLQSAGENRDTLISGWSEKMQLLQAHCNEWADQLQQDLAQAKEAYSVKLQLANKRIKRKEALQLTGAIATVLALVVTVLALAFPLIGAVGIGWSFLKAPATGAGYSQLLFYGINIGLPVVAGILSLVNGWAARSYHNRCFRRLLWLFMLLDAFIYISSMGPATANILLKPHFLPIEIMLKTSVTLGVWMLLFGLFRTLLEYFFSKLSASTRSRGAKAACKVGTTAAGIAALAQALVYFFIAGLFLYALIIG